MEQSKLVIILDTILPDRLGNSNLNLTLFFPFFPSYEVLIDKKFESNEISNNLFTVASILSLILSWCFVCLIHFDYTVDFSSKPEASEESNRSC